MKTKWKAMLVCVTVAAIGLMVAGGPAPGQGGKKPMITPSGNITGTAPKEPHARYHYDLEFAMKCIKEAEKHILNADIKELNFNNTNPVVVARLATAVKHLNNVYALVGEAKAAVPATGGGTGGTGTPAKKPGK